MMSKFLILLLLKGQYVDIITRSTRYSLIDSIYQSCSPSRFDGNINENSLIKIIEMKLEKSDVKYNMINDAKYY